MQVVKVALLTLLLVPTLLFGEPHWIQMRSDSFRIFSSAGERATRDTLKHFEQVRTFFLQALQGEGKHLTQPVTIVAFGNRKDYEQYQFNEVAAAYYRPGADTDYIVLSQAGVEAFPVAVHEYFHLVAHYSGATLPLWLNEGMAEMYSTLEPRAGKILVGALIPGRHAALLQDKWVPLSAILTADHDSPYYNEKKKAGNFYNESWALTHMLALSNAYRPRFDIFLASITQGLSSVEALEKAYMKPVGLIEKDLRDYLHGNQFQGVLFSQKLAKITQELPAEPAPAFDVALTLAELKNRVGGEEEARQAMEALVQMEPKRPEPYAALGYLAGRTGKPSEAVEHFRRAYEHGARSSRFLWDYGQLASHEDPEGSAKALGDLLALEPGRQEVRLLLATIRVSASQFDLAMAALAPIKKVSSADAPRYFRLLAYTRMKLGHTEEALVAARRWQQYAPDAEKPDAARFVEFLAASKVEPVGPPREQPTPDEEDRPRLARRDPPAAPGLAQATPSDEEASGEFQRLDCSGPQAKIVILTIHGRQSFLIESSDSVQIDGGAPMDLTCGAQTKKVAVHIRYRKPPAGGSVDGVVRTLRFGE